MWNSLFYLGFSELFEIWSIFNQFCKILGNYLFKYCLSTNCSITSFQNSNEIFYTFSFYVPFLFNQSLFPFFISLFFKELHTDQFLKIFFRVHQFYLQLLLRYMQLAEEVSKFSLYFSFLNVEKRTKRNFIWSMSYFFITLSASSFLKYIKHSDFIICIWSFQYL